MKVYAESSAVISWLLRETAAPRVEKPLEKADRVFASELTLVESDRAIIRLTVLRQLNAGTAGQVRARLLAAAANWQLLPISPDVLARARQSFPAEPIRTLDAIHLASALIARQAAPDVQFLTLDEHIRAAARDLGFQLQPA